MADLADGQFVPRVGAYLAENIKYEERIQRPKTISKKHPVEKVRSVLENSKDINKKIEANHELSQLIYVEKSMNGIGCFEISKYNPLIMSWIQFLMAIWTFLRTKKSVARKRIRYRWSS
jgi:hypothetical protein